MSARQRARRRHDDPDLLHSIAAHQRERSEYYQELALQLRLAGRDLVALLEFRGAWTEAEQTRFEAAKALIRRKPDFRAGRQS